LFRDIVVKFGFGGHTVSGGCWWWWWWLWWWLVDKQCVVVVLVVVGASIPCGTLGAAIRFAPSPHPSAHPHADPTLAYAAMMTTVFYE